MSNQSHCEVCGIEFKVMVYTDVLLYAAQQLDHIFPRRWLANLKLNPHDRLNIIALCQSCHGVKKKAEERLFQGDVLGYLQALKTAGWPLSYVWRAARQYELKEVLSFFRSESELR
jgi:HNH endonuclease